MHELFMKSITFCLSKRGHVPMGGYKVVYEYANRLVEKGYRVVINYPAVMFQHDDTVMQRLLKVVKMLYHYLWWHLTGYSCQ
jgi:hypothetical protein